MSYERMLLDRLIDTNDQLLYSLRIIEKMGNKLGLDGEGEAMTMVRNRVRLELMTNEPVIKQTVRKLRTAGIERQHSQKTN